MGKVVSNLIGTDEELIAAIKAGDSRAFTALSEKYSHLLHSRAAKFTRDVRVMRADAYSDARQEACLALHRAALHYTPREHVTFGRFATVCVENRLKDMRRNRRASGMADLLPLEDEGAFEEFRDCMVEKERAGELLSRIRRILSSYEYRVFRMYMIKGITVAEIAEKLGREEKSVRNALSRLLVKLRNRLGH